MHPSSLLSYYPTYAILDEILSFGNYKKLNIFIDLKNALQTTYMQHAIVNIVESSKKSKYLDTSIFSSLIAFLGFHKIYSHKRGIDIKFVVFFETGHSYYHKNISKQYKISRKVDDLYGLDRVDRELFYKALHGNFNLIEKACNLLPDISVVKVPNLEADFVPYYLLTRHKIPCDEVTGNIIYSNDHDMWQTTSDNTFIYSKSAKSKKIIKSGKIMDLFLRRKTKINDSFLPLAMSVIGDVGDDVYGVNGIGPSRFIDIFPQLTSLTGNMEQIYDKVENKKDLFESVPESIVNKNLKNVVDAELSKNLISNNLRMVSFELISRALDNPMSTEMIDKRNIINKYFTEKEIYPLESIKKALEKYGVFLTETSIDLLYI